MKNMNANKKEIVMVEGGMVITAFQNVFSQKQPYIRSINWRESSHSIAENIRS